MAHEPVAWVHLDPLGGIAGDMFAAALLDARPELEGGLGGAIAAAGVPPGVRLRRDAHRDHALTGSRLAVEVPDGAPPSGRYAAIVERLTGSDLEPGARSRALDIYRRLAAAESQVHGVAVADIHFHELADWDSYVDIVAAAWLIERLGASGWSCGPLPLGRGRVNTAHGALPVPAPATALLLRGLEVIDDGIGGERVTPTGAAILAHLGPSSRSRGGRVAASGHGFGSRRLDGVPNLLRALLLVDASDAGTDSIGVIRFEIDDQTSEDLAIGLDRLRALEGVRDVCQWAAVGKKGRMMAAVQVLCAPESLERVALACLSETATIGLRTRVEARTMLPREAVEVDGRRAKRVRRPGGASTIKAESDEVGGAGDYAARAQRKRTIEGDR